MKKIILTSLIFLFYVSAKADDYGEFRARVINNPANPTANSLVIGSQINVLLDMNPNYYPNNFGNDSDFLNKKHFLYFSIDFILVDKNGIYPDVFLDNQLFDIFGVNLQHDEPVEFTARHWNADNPITHSITISPCHYLQNTTYQLAVRVNSVSQGNQDGNNGFLFNNFTLDALDFTSGAYQVCQLFQADFQLASGAEISGFNCMLNNILEFDFTDPTAVPALSLTSTAVLSCTTMQYEVHMQASGGLQPYSYKEGSTPTGQDLLLKPDIFPYTLWATDAYGCSVFEKIKLETFIELFPDSKFDYPNGLYITKASQIISDVNGDGFIRIKGPLIIEEGIQYTLTNKSIQFARDIGDFNWKNNNLPISGIVVKSFAKLTATGCKFTGMDLCEAMWDGIQVRGDAHPPLQLNESGTVWFPGELILNNSEIRDAFTGVALYDMNYQLPFPINGAGSLRLGNGKITSTASRFINNRIGIAFKADFENFSESKITQCSFVCNALLKDQVLFPGEGTDKFISIIELDDVSKRIEIKANTFEGNLALPEDKRGTGIYSSNSSYLVSSGKIGSSLVRNEFLKLTKGIDVYSTGSLSHVVRIKDNRFENVMQGITANGSHFDEISFNDFYIPAGTTTVNSWGLNLYNAAGYLATENSFSTLATSNYTYGILARNNSLITGSLYRNTFSGDFYAATQSEQTNTKLELKCNTYTGNNLYDWAVTSGSLADQGICAGIDTQTPAGNRFGICTASDESQIYINSLASAFTYAAHQNNIPNCFTVGMIIDPCISTFDAIASCPTQVDPPVGIGKGPGGKKGVNEFKKGRVAEIRRLQEEGNISGIVNLLTNGSMPEDVYLVIPTLLERGDCATARLKLASVDLNTNEGQAYFSLFNVLTTLCEGNRNIDEMTANESQQIKQVSESNTRVSVHAQSVLAQLNEKAYLRVAERLNTNKSLSKHQQNIISEIENSFSVYPNPSNSEITIVIGKQKSGTLVVADAMGRMVLNENIIEVERFKTNLSQGIYVIQFTDLKGNVERKQVIIQE